MSIKIPPGVFDILPQDPKNEWKCSHLWQYVESTIRQICTEYGYQEIRTPLFERTELFQRSVGETTDIVSKEMYTFEDRGNRLMSLRPEGTAPVMRAFIENQLQNLSKNTKLFYIAPMFRYERQQAGRYRQHHQFGAEAIGNNSPEQDAELIDLIYSTYTRLGIQNMQVMISSLGDNEDRAKFRNALKTYLADYRDELSEESRERFEVNPLRILDSKNAKDQEIVENGPVILDYLSDEAKSHFDSVQENLTLIGIPYVVNPKIVRGLDYYNRTVFEITASELGAQNSIGGGGRYDGLIKSLGGPDLPSIGFGSGIERIIQTMLGQGVSFPEKHRPDLFLIPLGDAAKSYCFQQLKALRSAGVPTEMDFSGRKLNKVMQEANQIGAKHVLIIGDSEMEKKEAKLKEMESGNETLISLETIIQKLKEIS